MPGKMGVDFIGYDKYKGAQRAIVALLFANDTFGADVDWLIQGDDDTMFHLPALHKATAIYIFEWRTHTDRRGR